MKLETIRNKIINDIETFKNNIKEVNSFQELGTRYNLSSNGKSYSLLKDCISKNNIAISHWDRHKSVRIHTKIKKICPQCKIEFICLSGGKRNKTCCGFTCSNIYFSLKRHTDESNQKVSESLKKYHTQFHRKGKIRVKLTKLNRIILFRDCLECKTSFKPKNNNACYCSPKCRNASPIYREKLRQIQLKKVKDGTHSGWKSRNKPSYAELFFMDVLKNNNIKYEFEKICGKYFIDFAIESKKIALEIDGRQHLMEDRKKSDNLKDDFLKSDGWSVYRIPWKSINTESGKSFIKKEIDKFLEFYNNGHMT